jgi:hypothetical protein
VIAGIIELAQAVRAVGKKAIVATIMPVGSDAGATKKTSVAAANAGLPAACAANGFPCIPWHTVIPLDVNGFAESQYIQPDTTGVHPTPLAGFLMGSFLAERLDSMVAKDPQIIAPADGNAAWVTPIPYFAGGFGLQPAIGGRLGWATQHGGALTTSYRRIADADGLVWQEVSNTDAVINTSRDIYNRITTGASAWAGRTVRGTCRFKAIAEGVEDNTVPWGGKGVQFSVICYAPTNRFSSALQITTAMMGYFTDPLPVWAGHIVTNPIVVPAGVTQIWAQIFVYGPGCWRIAQTGVYALD